MNNTAEVLQHDVQETGALEKRAVELADIVTGFQVISAETRTVAIGMLTDLVSEEKRVTAHYAPHKKRAHETWKGICDDEKKHLTPIQTLTVMLKGKINTYDLAEKKKAEEAQKKAEAEAAEKARKEKEKLETKAEKALEKGKEEKAEALLEQAEAVVPEPVFVPAPAAKQTVETASGAKVSTRSDIEIVFDGTPAAIKDLCRAVADGEIPVAAVKVVESVLKTWAKNNGLKRFEGFGFKVRETSGLNMRGIK